MGGTFTAIKLAERRRLSKEHEMAHTRDPNDVHHAYLQALDDAGKRFPMISPAERLAVAAQFVGQLIGEMPDHYDKREIMEATARNMQAGNDAATGGAGSPLLLNT